MSAALSRDKKNSVYDILVVGAGPAGLVIAAALCQQGARVACLAQAGPDQPWPNTYGIWADDLDQLGLGDVLSHRWTDTSCYALDQEIPLQRAYGLFDNQKLKARLLETCQRGGMDWHCSNAVELEQGQSFSVVTGSDFKKVSARLVIDTSGHNPVFVRRPSAQQLAFQTAYGVAGIFSVPPVRAGQMVLMDYRSAHLSSEERRGPPTFLYAMDLGNGLYFVEETSLAHTPALSFEFLQQRLERRLAWLGTRSLETRQIERCIFPMNAPLPDLNQDVFGFGASASMVHPASGYLIGGILRRAPELARSIIASLDSGAAPRETARRAWSRLWPLQARRKRGLYLFGLGSLLSFDQPVLEMFFAAFFNLPPARWSSYLSDTLSTAQVMQTMLALFISAPAALRLALIRAASRRPSVGGAWGV